MFVASVGIVLFGAVLSAYYSTLFPSIPGGDSGELVAEACHLGVAHPPGYPLFILLGHLAIKLPLPEAWLASPTPAYRVNLMNATFGGLTALVMFHCVILMCKLLALSKCGDSRPFSSHLAAAAGILAAACYSFGPLQWLYAVGAEVFALNNFATAVLVWLTLRYAENPTHTNVLIGALFCGVAMTNQHTIVLFEIPVIAWILVTRRKVLTVVAVLQYAGCFFLGMTPYLYLVISDTFFPQPMSWGDCSTLTGFFKHFVRADYGTFRLYAHDVNSAGVWDRIRMYAENFASIQVPSPIAVPGVPLGIVVLLWTQISTVVLFRKHTALPTRGPGSGRKPDPPEPNPVGVSTASWPGAVIGTWLFYLIVFHYLSNMPMDDPLLYGVHARFWMQPNVVTCLFIGVASWFAVDQLFQLAKVSGTVAYTLSFVVLVASAGTAAWLENRSHEISDQSQNWYLTNYSKALMSVVPENSILITAFDQQWTTVRYLHECEGFRSDLEVFNAPMLSFAWFERQRSLFPRVKFPGKFLLPESRQASMGTFTIASFVDANLNNPHLPGGVFWAGTLLYDNEKKFAEMFDMEQHGLISKMIPKRAGPAPLEDMLAVEADWNKAVATLGPLPNITVYNYETWEWTVHEDYWAQAENRGTQLLDWAVNHVCPDGNLNATMLLQACYLLEGSFAHKRFAKSASTYKNLGLAHVRLVQHKGEWPTNVPLPRIPGLPDNATVSEWKSQSAMRVLELWSKFLEMPGSAQDPSYDSVLDIVNILRRAAGKQAVANANNQKTKQATSKK